MKIFCLFLISLLVAGGASAQNVDKLITEKEVTRLIGTLAADDMGGRSATGTNGGIEKAAAFIEGEFKQIGLQPLTGTLGFQQKFPKERIRRISATVKVNGETVSPQNFVVRTDKDKLNWTSNVTVQTVTKEDELRQLNARVTTDSTNRLVLVDTALTRLFRQLQSTYSRSVRLLNAAPAVGSVVFILTKTPATSYAVQVEQKRETFDMANVVGVLPGKDPKRRNEMVVFSGHYDHLGIRPAVAGDSIANGADDDASGTTAVIALAKYFKGLNNNARTIVFAAFTAEEIGGYGSQYFSQQLNADQVVAMFNIEMIGKASKFGPNSAFITGYERSDFGKILQKNLTGTAFTFHPDPYPTQNLFYRSDNATLARLGVPAHTVSTDQIDVDAFYHTVNDEVETLDMANITRTIRAIALSARSIVAGTDTPARIDKATVK